MKKKGMECMEKKKNWEGKKVGQKFCGKDDQIFAITVKMLGMVICIRSVGDVRLN